MLNAGNLSLTLGLTQVRLKLGEVLAHCTRLFHKKPHTYSRHMEDAHKTLISHKSYNYSHRESLVPSYLVIRSKPETLGYFVVDYNPTVQSDSPPNIIPYTSATLQFLSEKVFFTPLI
jgi:hypothetical protein